MHLTYVESETHNTIRQHERVFQSSKKHLNTPINLSSYVAQTLQKYCWMSRGLQNLCIFGWSDKSAAEFSEGPSNLAFKRHA